MGWEKRNNSRWGYWRSTDRRGVWRHYCAPEDDDSDNPEDPGGGGGGGGGDDDDNDGTAGELEMDQASGAANE